MERRENNLIWRTMGIIEKWFIIIAAMVITGLMFTVAILRTLFVAFAGWEEIVILCTMWMYFIGVAYVSRTKSHMIADVLGPLIKSEKTKAVLEIIRRTPVVILDAVLMSWAFNYMVWQYGLAPLTSIFKIPLVLNYIAILLGCVMMLFYETIYLYDNIKDCLHVFRKDKMIESIERRART